MLLTFPILCLFYSKPAAPPNKYCLDKRVQPSSLSPDEKAKHSYYSQRYQEEVSCKYYITTRGIFLVILFSEFKCCRWAIEWKLDRSFFSLTLGLLCLTDMLVPVIQPWDRLLWYIMHRGNLCSTELEFAHTVESWNYKQIALRSCPLFCDGKLAHLWSNPIMQVADYQHTFCKLLRFQN